MLRSGIEDAVALGLAPCRSELPALLSGQMDNVNYSPRMTLAIGASGALAKEPFILVDVGCSLGIDSVWRHFAPHLRAYGIEPDAEECERLKHLEHDPHVQYFPFAVGLPTDNEFLRLKAAHEGANPPYASSVLCRSTVRDARFAGLKRMESAYGVQRSGPPAQPEKVALADFFRTQYLSYVDFVKVDTDGSDLEALLSAEPAIQSSRILGFMVECMFQGSAHETSNTFHNIDRFMKRHGFMIYAMTIWKYSRQALPSPFVFDFPAQTVSGQPLWGDVVFLRDPAGAAGDPDDLNAERILKLACLYEIFSVPDCAAELLLKYRSRIAPHIDPDSLLDALTPEVGGQPQRYADFAKRLAKNPETLFPGDARKNL